MAADSDLQVALIGYGLAGSAFHAPFVAGTQGLRLATIVTSNEERAASARRAHPHARILPSADELWTRPDEHDLVVIASPNRTHASLAEAALEAGLPTVVDKPLAASAPDGRRLAELAERRSVLLTVFQNRRWDGDFLTLRRLLEEGRLGDVVRFESRFERWRPEVSAGAWRELSDPAEAGGVLFDLGSHLIDQAVVLFGQVTRVYAEVDRRRAGAEVPDDVFVALRHASGVCSHLWASQVASRPAPRLRVIGSRAGYEKWGLDVQEDSLRAGGAPGGPDWGRERSDAWGVVGAGDEAEPVETEPGDYGAFYRGVVAALRDGAPAPVRAEEGVLVLELIEAAQRSASNGTVEAPG